MFFPFEMFVEFIEIDPQDRQVLIFYTYRLVSSIFHQQSPFHYFVDLICKSLLFVREFCRFLHPSRSKYTSQHPADCSVEDIDTCPAFFIQCVFWYSPTSLPSKNSTRHIINRFFQVLVP